MAKPTTQTKIRMQDHRATLAGLSAIFWWSLSALFISYTDLFPPFLTAAFILGFGFLTFLGRWILTHARIIDYLRQPFTVSALGFLGLGGYTALYICGLRSAPIVEANVCNYVWPAVLALVAARLNRQRLRWPHLAGLGISFLGLVVLMGSNTGEGFVLNYQIGHLLALAAGIVWGVYSAVVRRFSHIDSNGVGQSFGLSSIAFFLLGSATETWPLFRIFDLWPLLAGGVCSHLGYYFWDIGMKKGDVQLLSASAYLIPVLSTLWLVLFQRAGSTGPLWLGVLIVVGGSIMAGYDRRKPSMRGSSKANGAPGCAGRPPVA